MGCISPALDRLPKTLAAVSGEGASRSSDEMFLERGAISAASYRGTGFRELRRAPEAERSSGIISVDEDAGIRGGFLVGCGGLGIPGAEWR